MFTDFKNPFHIDAEVKMFQRSNLRIVPVISQKYPSQYENIYQVCQKKGIHPNVASVSMVVRAAVYRVVLSLQLLQESAGPRPRVLAAEDAASTPALKRVFFGPGDHIIRIP